ncbi:MAG: cell wall hydrolase [Asticcacaulis sp.]
MTSLPFRARSRVIVLAIGGTALFAGGLSAAYMGGFLAHQTNLRAKAERMMATKASGDVRNLLDSENPYARESALRIALRFDPYAVAGSAQRDRQTAMLAQRLERVPSAQGSAVRLRKVSVTQAGFSDLLRPAIAARPMQFSGRHSTHDVDCLTQALYHEARGEGPQGMRAVAQVILNRVRHPAYPKTVCDVVYQGAFQRSGCQFSFTCNGAMSRRVERWAWRQAETVALEALSGKVMAEVGTATHFHTTAVQPDWSGRLIRVAQVGQHIFYRFNGRNGTNAALSQRAEPSQIGPNAIIEPLTPTQEVLAPVSPELSQDLRKELATFLATEANERKTDAPAVKLKDQSQQLAPAPLESSGKPTVTTIEKNNDA